LQEGEHRFQGGLFVEILSGLGPQGNGSACIDKIADFDHVLALADVELCSGETEPTSLKSSWISSNGSRSSLGWGGFLE
jgi:hypothetical protein